MTRTELAVGGMTCASCVAHVTRGLSRVPGVETANVNLATERATIEHAADVEPATLIAAIERAGYTASAPDADARRRDREIATKRRLLILAIVFFVPTFVLGMFRRFRRQGLADARADVAGLGSPATCSIAARSRNCGTVRPTWTR